MALIEVVFRRVIGGVWPLSAIKQKTCNSFAPSCSSVSLIMVRSVDVGGTDYSHQSFDDMLVDLEDWIALLRLAQEQYHGYVQKLKESGYWNNVITRIPKLWNLLEYSIKFYNTSEKELTEILEEIRNEVQPHHITRIESLYKTALKLEDRYFAIWGDACVGRIRDYSNADFNILDDLHSLGREVTADLRDLSNLAQRLKDFVGRKGIFYNWPQKLDHELRWIEV